MVAREKSRIQYSFWNNRYIDKKAQMRLHYYAIAEKSDPRRLIKPISIVRGRSISARRLSLVKNDGLTIVSMTDRALEFDRMVSK